MTKKTTPNKTVKTKKMQPAKASKGVKPKSKAQTSGRPNKVAKLEPVKKKTKSAVSVKNQEELDPTAEKNMPIRRGRKPKQKTDSELEIKVREIVKKTKSKALHSEDKKESPIFNLDDVRAIIKKRKVEDSVAKKKGTEKRLSVNSFKS